MSNLSRAGRELQVQLLLDKLRPVVAALSETEIAAEDSVVFKNYKVFYPKEGGKGYRLLLLIREDMVAVYSPLVLKATKMEIWLKLRTPTGGLLICSAYRQWLGSSALEEEVLVQFCDSIREFAATYDRIVVVGDLNLDVSRTRDTGYYRRRLLKVLLECMDECGFLLANEQDMSPTYYSHGNFSDKTGSAVKKMSVLDHIYYRGLPTPSFSVLPVALTDHRPVIVGFDLLLRSPSLRRISRRNFKSIHHSTICCAINAEALSRTFAMEDVEEIHSVLTDEITAALDLVAPKEQVLVKERDTPLYLTSETRRAMWERDRAALSNPSNLEQYRRLRNRAARLVRRDKLASNVRHLREHGFDPKEVWHLANSATGRSARSVLPSELVDEENGDSIRGDASLADCVNKFFISKIDKIRSRIDEERAGRPNPQQQQQQQQQPQQPQQQDPARFRFRVPSEREVQAAILGLNNTRALGVDGIPVAVLKQLAPVIAAPVAHLIKKSFEHSVVPSGFKKASIIPLHKKK